MGVARRPKLGQHFLASEGFRRRIADALPLGPDDLVLEIGPGRGAMTGLLAQRAGRVVAVELDSALAEGLRQAYASSSHIEIVQGDILTADIATLCRERHFPSCFVYGNLPYYITSPIVHHLLDSAPMVQGMALLMQREVAERLTATPCSRDYGYLSVLVQLHADPRIAFNVPPGAFSPPPKVRSSLVTFEMQLKYPLWTAEERSVFLLFVQSCFAHKRKSLLNNLGAAYAKNHIKESIEELQLPATARAEELTLGQFVQLQNLLQE